MILFKFLFLSILVFAQDKSLIEKCRQNDILSCESLATYFIERKDFTNSLPISEALCKNAVVMGCTLSGSAKLAQGKVKEAYDFFNKACDQFEPLACRSLGRLMGQGGEKDLAQMFFRRSCQFGLLDICYEVENSHLSLSTAALNLVKSIRTDCAEMESLSCKTQLNLIGKCSSPLTKKDCLLLAGYMTLYFHSRARQAEAKIVLLKFYAHQKDLKDSAYQSYSYDLPRALKNFTPHTNYQYIFGVMKNCSRKFLAKRKVRSDSFDLFPASYKNLRVRPKANILNYFETGKASDCYDPKHGYEAYAVSVLDPANPTHLDVWKIDQDKKIIHVLDGSPIP